MRRRWAWCLLIATTACSHPSGPPAHTDPSTLVATLNDLAAFGPKHVGSDAGHRAGQYVLGRMQKLGLGDAHTEPFDFPRHVVDSSALALSVDGAAASPGFDVFEGSGSGHADADVVYVGTATPGELMGKELHGKIALVDRSRSYHRAAQYANVSGAGAVAMLYVSAAPDNLRQVGSVRFDGWSALGPIPAVTLGSDDGTRYEMALGAGSTVHATVDVQAHAEAATGNNVVARIPGSDPTHQIVLGAHYDTWFAGSCDNGGGIAALLGVAARRLARGKPRYTLVFVAYDGEEVALYGGYDYLRRHRIVAHDAILTVLNFEMPAARDSTLLGLARSNHDALDRALLDADLGFDYPLYAAMDQVPILFGGIIPTDIQGIYRNGVPTASTAVDTPWYHTVDDTPDKVDATNLAQAVDDFDTALTLLMKSDPAAFATLDPMLWQATIDAPARAAGAPLVANVAVADAAGVPQPGATVIATLLYDGFFPAAQLSALSDDGGRASFTFPASAADAGSHDRFLHVTAGPTWPLVEQLLALP